MDTEESSFNVWMKQRRRTLDMTQEDLADRVGCSTITIQKIELGERRPSRQVAQRLAECLKIPAEEHEAFVLFARGEETAAVSPVLVGFVARPAAYPPASTPNNLPTPLTPLVDREAVLGAAYNYLLRQDVRLLTLTGMPGIGKTRLSLEVAALLLPEFTGGVYFVELASISEPELVASTIGTAIGHKELGGGSYVDGLKEFLRDRRMLLVLDNFEQVLDAAPIVIDLLRACPSLKILVTSREALHIMGEQQLPVPPLEVPDVTSLPGHGDGQALLSYPAVELFVQRAAAVDPGFALTKENYATVAAICARLEGIPLAIELAAARIKMLTPADLLCHLDRRLNLLTGGPRHLPARLQTLRGAIDWSYRLLSPAEQALFVRLGVFVGGATLEAIQAVSEMRNDEYGMRNDPDESIPHSPFAIPHSHDVLEGVGSLVDKNLLRREGSESRFAMLETVREYAWEKLQESEHAEEIKRAHALYFLHLAEEAHKRMWGPDEPGWLDRLQEEHDNLRAALQWSLGMEGGSGSVEIALRLVAALGRFWAIRGFLSEGRERIASVLSNPGTGEPEVRGWRGWALSEAAALAFWQSDYAAARTAFEEALALFQELGDKKGIAYALADLGDVSREEGDFQASAVLSQQALSIYQELGDDHGTVTSLALLGWAEMRPGHYARATAHLEAALALARQLRMPNRVALALCGLGEAMVRQGEYEKAITFLEESLAIRRASGYRWGMAAALGTLGWANLRRGDLEAASTMLMESLTLRKELRETGGVAWCLEKLAEIRAIEDRPLHATRLLGAAQGLRQCISAKVDAADRPDVERTITAIRSQLSGQAFSLAWAEGEAMTFEQVVDYAQSSRGGTEAGMDALSLAG